jgi:hypothetical protein
VDDVLGLDSMADYLLWFLNRYRRFEYVSHLGLEQPDDNVRRVLATIAANGNMVCKKRNMDTGETCSRAIAR